MRKSNFKILALTAALIMPLSSCKETIIYVTPDDTPNDDIKTPIELSVGGVDGAVESSTTRAVITDGNNKSLVNFDAITNIYFIMKSEYDENNVDYQGSHDPKYTVARGKVNANDNKIQFEGVNQRYWDDAHARSSKITMWAYAQKRDAAYPLCKFEQENPDATDQNPLQKYKDEEFNTTWAVPWKQNSTEVPWRNAFIYPAIRTWKVSGATGYAQTETSIHEQDLMFSNNLSNDKVLKFNTNTRKFPTGNDSKMIFYHALSKITVRIIADNSFTATSQSNDFKFTSGNVKLSGFNTSGIFHIQNGQFEYIHDHADIASMYLKTTSPGPSPNVYYTLEALVIPNVDGNATGLIDTNSKLGKESDEVSMEFTIDNSNYKLKQKDLFKAIKDKTENNIASDATEIKLEAGKNYIFTFVVGKTKIEHLTATVAQWKDIEAESFTPIIDVSQNYGEKGSESDLNKTYTLLRSTSKAGSYGNGSCSDGNSAKMEYNTTDNKYNAMAPQLYWPDHKTHYFFRGVYPEVKTSAQTGYPTIDTEGKTISVTNCAYETGSSPSDLMIGIPRKSNGDLDETCKVTGTNHGTSVEGICATSGNINLNFRYAMSQVEVRLTTNTATGATDAVNIATAKVEVINGCNGGAIKLEDSSVASRTTGDFTIGMTTTDTETKGNSSVIPQSLTNGSNNLRFKITIYKEGSTTEEIDDIYYADIKDIQVKEGTSTTSKAITSWEAGKHYIYTLNLSKTEIKVSATITDWVTATGSTNVWF